MRIPLCCLALAIVAGTRITGQSQPPTVEPVRVMQRMDLKVQLGPTGASGYVFGAGIVVRDIQAGSPASGVLQPGDYIVGVDGKTLVQGQDPRRILGTQIGLAEAKDGKLRLSVRRRGRVVPVEITLAKRGAYAATWPYDCQKSSRILREACEYLHHHQFSALIRTNHVIRACNALLLLARGQAKDLELVRRAAYVVVDDPLDSGYQGWSRSYTGILLAEYWLATRDPLVLPKLRELAKTIPAGQMACGSWGHRMPWDGYGAVNQIGLACYLAMILIEDCGIDVDDEAMENSTKFFERYAGKGWIPYGDHAPWRGKSGNGKNGLAAVAYDLLGGHAKATAQFGLTTAASHEYREEGHTGAFFSFLWGPLGAARAPRERFQVFVDRQQWYYDLARRPDGGLVCQPNPENLSGRTPGTYTRWGAAGTTGAMALLYAIPTGNLRIFGKSAQADGTEGKRVKTMNSWAIQAIRREVQRGDFFMAGQRMTAVLRSTPDLAKKMRPTSKKLATVEDRIRQGADYHRNVDLLGKQARARRILERLARSAKGYYGRLARATLTRAPRPTPAPGRWSQVWDSHKPRAFACPDRPGALKLIARCRSGSKLSLNGTLVAVFGETVGKRKGMSILLPESVSSLLRAQDNRFTLEGAGKRDSVRVLRTGGQR